MTTSIATRAHRAASTVAPFPKKTVATPSPSIAPGLLADMDDDSFLLLAAYVAAETGRRSWPRDVDVDHSLLELCRGYHNLAAIDTSNLKDAAVGAYLARQEDAITAIAAMPACSAEGVASKLSVLAAWEHWRDCPRDRHARAEDKFRHGLAADATRLRAIV